MIYFSNLKKSKVALNKRLLSLFIFSQSLLNKTSINKLTLIGFTFVAMPLVMALLFGASKVSQLAKQSTTAIYHVAQLTQLNNKLDDTIAKVERSTSQYIVLKDKELLAVSNRQQKTLQNLIRETITQQQDKVLKELLLLLKVDSQRIQALMFSEEVNSFTLEQIQLAFQPLRVINEQLKKRSNFVVNQQVLGIHQTTETISNDILERLYIIPISLLIAGIFIVLITKPLKRLTDKIQQLEQGNFEQKINLHGPAEDREIGDALDNKRQRFHTLELQKSSIIRHISQELKTPLAAIREGTELIYDNSVGTLNDEQQEICDIIRLSVNRLQRLIEDLLDFNIVLDSTSLHDFEKINLAELITDVCEARKLDIKSKNLTLKCNNSPYFIISNSKQLSVILDNILSNAIKYSPLDAEVAITYQSNKDDLIINIVDQGPGIPPSLTLKVFDAFYQGKAPLNTQIKGSGLGLTIVKELLLRLNGTIAIVPADKLNATNKQGTCFTITLPNTQVENTL
jgi:two-component system sensor histidine kinase GlrK